MANIVTVSDFKGMIMIPQIGSPINTGAETVLPVNSALTELIDEKEPEALTKLFGYNLYRALKNGLAADPIDQRWIDLRDGSETEINGVWKAYAGVKPLITRYVYYWWLRENATQSTGVGEAINKTENAYRVGPAQKQVTAWNDMVKSCKSTLDFLYTNQSVYPEFIQPSQNGCIEFFLENSCNEWMYFSYCGYSLRCRRNEMLIPINILNL